MNVGLTQKLYLAFTYICSGIAQIMMVQIGMLKALFDIAPLSGVSMSQVRHACWCNKKVIVRLCVCTGENPLAKARGLSSRTYAQTIQ